MLAVLAFGIGTQEIIVVLIIVVVLFGATKIPQIGSAIGQGILNFKRGMREVKAEDEKAEEEERKKLASETRTDDRKAPERDSHDAPQS